MLLLMIGILLSYIIASFGWISTSALWKFQIKTSPSVRINPLFATTSTISEQTSNPKSTLLRQIDGVESDIFVCPESLAPLKLVRRQFGLVDSSYLRDDKFKREYPLSRQGGYLDLTVQEEDTRPLWTRSIDELIGEGFFQNPFISTVYERGYRDNFKNAGFPGIEKEYAEAEELFLRTGAQRVLDMSCASGFMMRRFLRSGRFASVLGADLSPNMLQEARRRCQAEGLKPYALVRCDVARLPFRDGSLDAIHAGAAMHCWPRVQDSLIEIYRVLKPGGALYASTFLAGGLALTRAAGSTPTSGEFNKRVQTGFQYFASTEQIKTLFLNAGFPNITSSSSSDDNDTKELQTGSLDVRLEGSGCVIIKAIKPKVSTL